MLDLVNKTPFVASLLPGLDKDGLEYLVVAIKATFTVTSSGATTVATEQVPVVLADVHSGEPGVSSVLYESDGALRKPGVDVVLVGSAHGPASAAASVDVELRIGAARKTVRVFGARVWKGAGAACRPSQPGRVTTARRLFTMRRRHRRSGGCAAGDAGGDLRREGRASARSPPRRTSRR